MSVVSVSMPTGLIERLDTHAANHEYTGRSEVIRESARAFLTEFDNDTLAAEPLAGVVTVFYDFDTHPVERQVTELRHEYDAHIASNDHSHVADYCVDLFVLESDLEVIAAFVGKLRAIGDVETVDYSLVPLDSIGQLQND
ncbi:CopG family ribbon-helix-helix protein [Natronorubrum daqingense]|uniref:Nickel-responsive regulator n=1 Tax=Natronorubrum daqingense TaxID=588898 RepID=A0A1N7EKQ5_9EURY|nr:CopG family ribbon-helix-helix protein [Natronorubrum daqingense]APX97894.1 nickel-responsive regulator [Natronorubrum daqingense]SIR88588.1 CopG family transcriptional regulator, nickel-responsive regulator [Natronorubrum daqingense]